MQKYILLFSLLMLFESLSYGQIPEVESSADVKMLEESTYTIRCAASGKYLDAHSPDVNKNGCKVQLWSWVGGTNQQWRISKYGSAQNVYTIRCVADGKCLDAHSPDVNQNGCKVQLWSWIGGTNQRWIVLIK